MKIKFWDRVILFFGALLAGVTGIFLVIIGLQFGAVGAGLTLGVRIVGIALGILCLLLCSYLFMLPQKLSYNKHDFVVQHTDNGELRIAVKAIENLVQKCIDVHDEINVISMQVNNSRDDVTVDLCISLPSNISIPLAVASLQKQIKQYLAASSGIDVMEVRVSVETAEKEADEAACLMPDEDQAAISSEKKEKKLPLHQRIFSKGEQNITVPEPPKAEETVEVSVEEISAEAPAEEDTPAVEEISATEEIPVAEEAVCTEEIPAEVSDAEEEQSEKEVASNE